MYKTILIFGPPGVGKGTQAKLISQNDKYFHFSTGEMFRGLDLETDIGRRVKQYTDNRELVADELTIELFRKTLEKYIDEGRFDPQKQILLLDGLPRNVNQVELIKDFVKVVQIIFFNVKDEQILVKRITGRAQKEGRVDDQNKQIVRRGIEVYDRETMKVLQKYDSELIVEIESSGTVEEIQKKVKKKIYKEE